MKSRRENLNRKKKIEEKKTKEAVQVAESLTTEEVAGEIGNLKIDIGKTLTRIADQMEGEVNRFVAIRNAIAAKETELRELYEIEKAAMTLAALIEAQNQKRQEFTAEMETKRVTCGRRSKLRARLGKKSRRSATPPSRSGMRRRKRNRQGRRRSSIMRSSGSSSS